MTAALTASTLQHFIDALEQNAPLEITKKGEWRLLNSSWLDTIQRTTRAALHALSMAVSTDLLLAEAYLIQLRNWHSPSAAERALLEKGVQLIKSRLIENYKKQETSIGAAKTLLKTAKTVDVAAVHDRRKQLQTARKNAKEFFLVKRTEQEIARFKVIDASLNSQYSQSNVTDPSNRPLQDWLQKKLQKWIKDTKVENIPLNAPSTQEKLNRFLHYTPFLETLRGDNETLFRLFNDTFKKWSLSSSTSVDCAILVPYARKWLSDTFMDERIKYYNSNCIQLRALLAPDQTRKYALYIPVEGELVDIATPTEKSAQLRRELLKQNEKLIDYEFVHQKGISRVDTSLKNMNFSHPAWWTMLPVVEEVTRQEIADRFGINFGASSKNYALYGVCASRKNRDLSVQDTHGNLMVAIPLENGKFNLIYPGKYAKIWPQGVSDMLTFIFKTHTAQLTFLDPNRTMNSRQQIKVCTGISREEFEKLMTILARDFQLSREENLVFQPQGDNCANWAFEVTKELFGSTVPEVYKVHFLKTRVAFPVSLLPAAKSCCPTVGAWNTFRKSVSYALGATQKHSLADGRKIALTDSKNWQEGYSTLPAQLFNNHQALRDYFSSRHDERVSA